MIGETMIGMAEALKKRREIELELKRRAEDARKKAKQIIEHPETVVLLRDKFPEAWEYVEQSFPRLAERIRHTKVYKNENTYFCKKLGIPKEAGGLFIIKASMVLICYGKFSDDVVIVHELLHFISQLIGSRFVNQDHEEDFAYTNSIPYLATRYDEEWIVNKYMLPYYWGREQVALGRKPTLAEKESTKLIAIEKCKLLIKNSLKNNTYQDDDEEGEEMGRFSFL